jgi:prepilin-type processing-associated H-X9-DG protein
MRNGRGGMSWMEIVVGLATILILASVAFPVYRQYQTNSHKAAALAVMKTLATAAGTYAGQNGDRLPEEDVKGKDDWAHAAEADANDVWYNALPRLAGRKSVGDFVKESNESAFYTDANMLHLPGAIYPEGRKMVKPLFAIAFNSKLQQKDRDGRKIVTKTGTVQKPERTVLFFERGLPGEVRSHLTISKKDEYNGAPKGTAKAFVARYQGKGLVAFVDGHVEETTGDKLFRQTGQVAWDEKWAASNPAAIFWTVDPTVDPNGKH